MSPELFDPEKFGLKDSRRTKRSDCYALGMVIYEVLSRRVPFHQHADFAVVVRVGKGERPGRPQGEEGGWFVDDVWSTLERCWEPSPCDRPSVKDILPCLERISKSWTSRSPQRAASPPTIDSPTGTEESTDGSEVSSPSQVVSPQPIRELPLTGDPQKNQHLCFCSRVSSPPPWYSRLPGSQGECDKPQQSRPGGACWSTG